MSTPVTSTSSLPLVSFAQDVNYSKTEGFKQFWAIYNQKNTRCTKNDPHGSYLTALEVYTTTKSSGMSEQDMATLSLQDLITSGAIAARHCLKCISLAPYYAAQMRRCTQKWDKHNNQGTGMEVVDTCQQLIGVVGTGLYHSMVDVQMTVGQTVDPTIWI